MLNKTDIEKAILGAMLFCDGYPLIAHILSARNFTSSPFLKHRELYQVISEMQPSKPIDIITVTHQLRAKYPNDPDVANWVLDVNQTVVSQANICHWAFILLEIDIADKYRTQLIEWKTLRDRDDEHVASAVLHEMIEMIQPNNDIFDIIDSTIEYFHKHDMQYEWEEAHQLFKDVAERARSIEKVNSIKNALRYLFMITQCSSPQVKKECEAFAVAISDMITTGQSNPRYTEAVNLIYK